MSKIENEACVKHAFSELGKANSAPLVDLFADDVRLVIKGSTAWSKTFTGKQSILNDVFGSLRSQFAEPYTVVVDRIIADENHVVVEARGTVRLKSGERYDNAYCHVFRMEGGKIREWTEYSDTDLIARVLRGPGPG